MDETTSKLLTRLRELEIEQKRIAADIEAIGRALELAGVKPDDDYLGLEGEYVRKRPFRRSRLVDACMVVLGDAQGVWLTKSQVEYLLTRGGFPFTAKDSKNSVDVTLRRLAAGDRCEVEVLKGKAGNRYRRVKKPVVPVRTATLSRQDAPPKA